MLLLIFLIPVIEHSLRLSEFPFTQAILYPAQIPCPPALVAGLPSLVARLTTCVSGARAENLVSYGYPG